MAGLENVDLKPIIVKEEKDVKESIDLSDNKENIKLKNWIPTTRLGRMVKKGSYKSILEIRRIGFEIKEETIIHYLLGPSLTYDTLSTKPIYDRHGIFRGYMSFVCAGDRNGHFGYSVKYQKCPDDSIKEALKRAWLSISSVSRYMHSFEYRNYYTVAYKVSATLPIMSGNLTVKLVPSFGDQGIVCNNEYITRMLTLAGIDNCVVEIEGNDQYIGNVALATYKALQKLEDLRFWIKCCMRLLSKEFLSAYAYPIRLSVRG